MEKQSFKVLNEKIENKRLRYGIMGSEPCCISIKVTEKEKDFFIDNVDNEFDNQHYSWDIEDNTSYDKEKYPFILNVCYTEDTYK